MIRISVFILTISFLVSCTSNNDVQQLPIYGNKTVVTSSFDSYKIGDTIYHHIPDFYLLNQDSIFVQKSDFDNKILLVDFFFVTCPTICPVMTKNMNDIVSSFSSNANVEFLSLSTVFCLSWKLWRCDPFHPFVGNIWGSLEVQCFLIWNL